MLFWNIFKFSFMRFFSYPYEILAGVIRVFIELCFLIFFWSLFSQTASNSLGVIGFASYFLIAGGVNELVMAQWGKFEGILGSAIKSGTINNYLIKPVSILPTFYAIAVGKTGVNKFLGIGMIIVGLLIQPPTGLSLLLFFIFFLNALVISYAYNVMIATIYFHSPEARGIRGALAHMMGIFSGLLIPLSLFPSPYQNILKLTPFPWMIFGPVNALRMNVFTSQVLTDIGIAIFWSVMFNLLAYLLWTYSIKKYEAVGI